MRELRSTTCANARADALGRPYSALGACSVPCSVPDMLKNRFPDRFRRSRISSLLQLAFLQANPPAAEHLPNKLLPALFTRYRVLASRPILSSGIMQAECLRVRGPGGGHFTRRVGYITLMGSAGRGIGS